MIHHPIWSRSGSGLCRVWKLSGNFIYTAFTTMENSGRDAWDWWNDFCVSSGYIFYTSPPPCSNAWAHSLSLLPVHISPPPPLSTSTLKSGYLQDTYPAPSFLLCCPEFYAHWDMAMPMPICLANDWWISESDHTWACSFFSLLYNGVLFAVISIMLTPTMSR